MAETFPEQHHPSYDGAMAIHEASLPPVMNPMCLAVLLSVTLLACGPGGGPGSDAGVNAADGGDASVDIAPPDIPWLEEGTPPIAPPILTPCPEGWHEVVQGNPEDPDGEMGVVTCDPYGTEPGGTEPDTCPTGQAHFPGDLGCTPVGAPCPAGDFPEGLPSGSDVLYVLAGAPPGGDGSEGSPVSTITQGLALASRGTIVAIGKGEYDEALRLPPGVTLWGACASETRLTASTWGPLAQGVITVPSPDTRVTNLWIGPSDLPGIMAYGDRASLSVDGIIINGARVYGLWALRGARIDGHELAVSNTQADTTGRLGHGIGVHAGSTLDVRRAWISENHEAGVSAADEGTSLTLSDAVVRDTQAQERGLIAGQGLNVEAGVTVAVTRTLLSRNRDFGILAKDNGTSVTLSDVVIRDTQAQESDGEGGWGVNLQQGAAMTVARALLARNGTIGMYTSGEGTSLTLSDVVIHDTQAQESEGAGGRALNVLGGAVVTAARMLLARNRDVGVFVDGDSTSLTLSDVVIRDTQAQQSDGIRGRGLQVQLGSVVTVTHALIARNREIGVHAAGEGTSLTLSDVVVHDTQARESDGGAGRGLSVLEGATVTATRMLLSSNREVGVIAGGAGTSLTLSDAVLRDTQGQESDGMRGGGLGAQEGATVTVTRTLLSQNRDLGVFAHSAGTAIQMLDVVVSQTDAQVCASATCAERPFGVGLLGISGARLSATRFAVRDGALCGVMVAEGGEVDLAIGEVSGFQIGVCLQVDGYSVPRLTDRVQYVNNDINLDTTSLPVPDLLSPLDEAP